MLALAVFTVLVFLFNLPSLSLAISGDDWMTVSKFLSYTQQDNGLGIFSPQIYLLTNYGFQSLWLTLVYLVFKDNNLGYFVIALLLRSLLAFSIYLFARKTVSAKVGILSGIVFATSSIAVESITEVSNMSVYLGISLALLACSLIATAATRKIIMFGQTLGFLSYAYVPTRLFVLPGFMPLMEFLRIFADKSKITLKDRLKEFLISLIFIFLLFLLSKLLFPGLGWQPDNTALAGNGLNIIKDQVFSGKWEILFYPLADLGQALSPLGVANLTASGWAISPLANFISSAFWLILLGTILILQLFDKVKNKNIYFSAGLSFAIILLLKVLSYYQPSGKIGEFSYFVWTYLGILYVLICGKLIIDSFITKKFKELYFYIAGTVFTFSILFPWLYSPFFFFGGGHRYLSLASVGIAMILGRLLYFSSYRSKRFWIAVVLLGLLIQQQFIAGRNFYNIYTHTRTAKNSQIVFTQLKKSVPNLATGKPSVFYFEGLEANTFFHTVAFDFGYRMQLLYDLPYGDENLPMAVDNHKSLQTEMDTKKITIEHVYGFKWTCNLDQNCDLIDISQALRERLQTAKQPTE